MVKVWPDITVITASSKTYLDFILEQLSE